MVMTGYGVAAGMVSGVMTVLNGVLTAAKVGWALLNMAMAMNPVLFIATSVGVLIGGVAALIYYWDDLKAAFLDTTWGKAIMGWLDKIMAGFGSLSDAWSWVKEKFSWVPGLGEDPMADVPNTQESPTPVPGVVDGPVAEVLKPQETIAPVPGLVDGPVAEVLKPRETIPPVPGLVDGSVAEVIKPQENLSLVPMLAKDHMAGVPKTSPSLEAPRRTTVPTGGVSQSIATAITNNSEASSQTIHIGQITTSRPITKEEVTSLLVMAS